LNVRSTAQCAFEKGADTMLDLLLLGLGFVLFVLSVGYAYACDWL
jgi:hypothetical protein